MDRMLKFRYQRTADDTLECFDSWILPTILASRSISNFVSQEAYERDSLSELETSVHVITLCDQSCALAVFDRTRTLVLFFQSLFSE